MAKALWLIAKNHVEIRESALPSRNLGEVRVKTLYSGLSKGTEKTVSQGLLMTTDREFMKCPNMEGEFPFPIKYGYCAVGEIIEGKNKGRNAFVLHPHQDEFIVSENAAYILPDTLPLKRAILAANMETALNAIWDGGVTIGQKVVVIGAGVVGLLIAYLAANILKTETWVIDIDPTKKKIAESLGAIFQKPLDSPDNADVVFHCSGTASGLACALSSAGFEAKVIEMSFYGDREPTVPLGAAFHPKRLQLVSSQVGNIAPAFRPRYDYKRRFEIALSLLEDARLDALISNEIAFASLEKTYINALNDPTTLTTAIKY